MSLKSSKYSSDLEKCYFNNIYKNQPSSLNLAPHNSFMYYSKSLHSGAGSSPRSFKKLPEFIDNTETDSIISSFRRLGVESASFSSVINLRNQSYLYSREHDCLDTLLLQMESTQEEPDAEKTAQKDVAKEDTVVLVSKGQPSTRSKVVKLARRSGKNCRSGASRCCRWLAIIKKLAVLFSSIDFQSKFYLLWLALVSFAYIYNLIVITLRYSFGFDNNPEGFVFDLDVINNSSLLSYKNHTNAIEYLTSIVVWFRRHRAILWFACDLCADLIYLVDIFLVQSRIKFIREGLWVIDKKSMAINYVKSAKFYVILTNLLTFRLANRAIKTSSKSNIYCLKQFLDYSNQ